MKYRMLKPLNREVSGLILGTMYLYNGSEEDGFKYLDMAVENGINIFDFAQAYGESEVTLGKWMKARNNRKDVVIITKGCHPNQFRDRVSDYDLQSDIMDSLAKLQTSYIDIYFIHKDNQDYPVGKLMEVLDANRRAGRILSYGVSNWTHERIQEANEYCRSHGLHELDYSSPNFTLADYKMAPWGPDNVSIAGPKNAAAREWYRKTQMPVFAFASLARGFFSGRITREMYEEQKNEDHNPMHLFLGHATKDELSGHTQKIDPICFNSFCFDENFDRLDRCRELAEKKGCSIPQIALAYIMNAGLNVWPIVGAANASELQSSAGSLDVKLSPDEVKYLDLEK
jgi:aryl-alcohol dehydrogenase-like predicted oxidoreductase